MLVDIHKRGISYDSVFRVSKRFDPDYNIKSVETNIINNFYCKKAFFTTKCTLCKTYQRGAHVFCSTCLDAGVRTRRLKGCRGVDCMANPKVYPDEVIAQMSIDTLREATCDHERVNGTRINSFTPVMHVLNIMGNNLDNRIISSTDQIIQHIENCSKNNSISSIMCHNSIYGFAALGEKDIAERLVRVFERVESMENNTDCFFTFVEVITDSNSIERSFYLKSFYFDIFFIIRG